MLRSLAMAANLLHSKLVHRKPRLCPVSRLYVGTCAGVPVVLDEKKQTIKFVHAGCCVPGILDS
jgi:hypothetical protein